MWDILKLEAFFLFYLLLLMKLYFNNNCADIEIANDQFITII